MPQQYDLLIENVHLASMTNSAQPYGEVRDAAVAISEGKIAYVGAKAGFTGHAEQIFDGQGQWLLPGFVDCHTHLVYAGSRADEFEKRLNGVSYAEISRQGGGIKSTVAATRLASFDSLQKDALKRASRLAEEGVTTIEIKSGYGLDLVTEINMLKVAKSLSQFLPIDVATTYLGAHALPLEYANRADDYIDFVCEVVMPEIAKQKLADSVDVFCESIGFDLAQCEKVFTTAKGYGLQIKAHAEQLSDLHGAKLAANFQALSVDHLEFLSEEDVSVLKQNNTVAVLLPGAFYFLNETKKPPVAALRQHNVPIAIATDLNPGSSPIASILTIMNMASVLFGLTPHEVLQGVTIHAATALGMDNKGSIAVGKDADMCLWDIQHPAELVYGVNQHRPTQKWFRGKHA
ncbi:imidazolonepropionase [Aliiglaciecola sp. LCG003]|uniref:imidazolonepropionase n=1 Tax=Aliiglaciecola sp. LCG003 TaxID=3053655 RepID=UPI00257293F4|nr:imidazolonepropionase [Aliiglaciecola sp. LCG003]WJG10722.1 imidazolonepropionase [Aliiglaciecola sp. LCG003]